MVRRIWLVAVVVALAGSARAQDTLSARLNLGVGGSVDFQVIGSDGDLVTTYGLDFAYAHRVSPNFAIGAGGGLLWWLGEFPAENGDDRNLFIDLGIRPEWRSQGDPLQLFGAGLLGLTWSSLGEDERPTYEIHDTIGYHAGLEFGGRFMLRPSAGIELALAYTHHRVRHETDPASQRGRAYVTQLLLRLGGVFGFGLSG